jgi:hypothetical protein
MSSASIVRGICERNGASHRFHELTLSIQEPATSALPLISRQTPISQTMLIGQRHFRVDMLQFAVFSNV